MDSRCEGTLHFEGLFVALLVVVAVSSFTSAFCVYIYFALLRPSNLSAPLLFFSAHPSIIYIIYIIYIYVRYTRKQNHLMRHDRSRQSACNRILTIYCAPSTSIHRSRPCSTQSYELVYDRRARCVEPFNSSSSPIFFLGYILNGEQISNGHM